MNASTSSQQTLALSHVPLKSQYYDRRNQSDQTDGGGHGNPGHSARHGNGAHENGSKYQRDREPVPYPRTSYADRSYSLPRQAPQQPQRHSQPAHNESYYTHDRRKPNDRNTYNPGNDGYYDNGASMKFDQPDFYFMPSQRKYSGEVVRVYVDHNKKDTKK